ncbi:WXG100 family type VII secretion target, partial [Streptomyces sp. TRM68367]|uniref:WXG100 family type VII secretion target n=1 Tax=Streptomyces sp. TRM68367 TaxID=2758415 RepID=UPI00165B72BB
MIASVLVGESSNPRDAALGHGSVDVMVKTSPPNEFPTKDNTDYNNGSTTQGPDGGIFGNNSVMGSASDYDNYDWKQIEAVIVGGSNLPSTSDRSRAQTVVNPQSLYDAGDTFQYVQEVLEMVAKALVDQANALAGQKDAPWQGAAADAFMNMMETFSKQVNSSAAALSGGNMGGSVAQTLVDAGNNLAVAQANVTTIDHWYGNQALKIGIIPMANGLIPISQSPQIVQLMTDDLRKVLHTLAGQYSVETRTLDQVSPAPITSPVGGPPTDPNPKPKVTYPKVTYPKVKYPKVNYPKVTYPKVNYPKVTEPDLQQHSTGGGLTPVGATSNSPMFQALNPSTIPGGTNAGMPPPSRLPADALGGPSIPGSTNGAGGVKTPSLEGS